VAYGQLRGHIRLKLIRELAMDVVTQQELAKRFGVDQNTIRTFRDRNEDDIREVRDSLLQEVVSETAGLWISKKANRIAEYQEDVEKLNESLARWVPGADYRLDMAAKGLMATKHNALKNVAEELAQLPTRSSAPQVDENVFHYTIVGATTDGLRGDLT
jgi:hypothetical protein